MRLSLDWLRSPGVGPGIKPLVNAQIKGANDALFAFIQGTCLAGIEYVGYDDQPAELPEPSRLEIY